MENLPSHHQYPQLGQVPQRFEHALGFPTHYPAGTGQRLHHNVAPPRAPYQGYQLNTIQPSIFPRATVAPHPTKRTGQPVSRIEQLIIDERGRVRYQTPRTPNVIRDVAEKLYDISSVIGNFALRAYNRAFYQQSGTKAINPDTVKIPAIPESSQPAHYGPMSHHTPYHHGDSQPLPHGSHPIPTPQLQASFWPLNAPSNAKPLPADELPPWIGKVPRDS